MDAGTAVEFMAYRQRVGAHGTHGVCAGRCAVSHPGTTRTLRKTVEKNRLQCGAAGPLLTFIVAILLALLRFLHGRLALRCLRPGRLLLMLRHPLRRSLCLVLGHPLLGCLRRMRGLRFRRRFFVLGLRFWSLLRSLGYCLF